MNNEGLMDTDDPCFIYGISVGCGTNCPEYGKYEECKDLDKEDGE